jgi:hypothetical protein
MRAHFKQPTSRWTPRSNSRHIITRGTQLARYEPNSRFEAPVEAKYRRKCRAESNARRTSIAFQNLGQTMAADVGRHLNSDGWIRRMLKTPEQCAEDKARELEEWKMKRRTEPRQLRYHAPPLRIGFIHGVNLITDTLDDAQSRSRLDRQSNVEIHEIDVSKL